MRLDEWSGVSESDGVSCGWSDELRDGMNGENGMIWIEWSGMDDGVEWME